MKKFYNFIILFAIVLIPFNVFADDKGVDISKYNTETLSEALKSEEITADLSNYTSDNNPINIYFFRGSGCSHCYEFLEYVSSDLIKEYGDKINFVILETWNDSNNAELFTNIAHFLGKEGGGVPFIVIGDQAFEGYASSMDSEITSAIDDLYNSNNRYDVMNEYDGTNNYTASNDSNEESTTGNNTTSNGLSNSDTAGWTIIISIIIGLGIIVYVNKKINKLQNEINNLKSKKSKK